jgi:hypothetical protein
MDASLRITGAGCGNGSPGMGTAPACGFSSSRNAARRIFTCSCQLKFRWKLLPRPGTPSWVPGIFDIFGREPGLRDSVIHGRQVHMRPNTRPRRGRRKSPRVSQRLDDFGGLGGSPRSAPQLSSGGARQYQSFGQYDAVTRAAGRPGSAANGFGITGLRALPDGKRGRSPPRPFRT